jgi:WD40 repeat protein
MVRSRYIVSSWDAATGSRTAGPVSRPGDLPAAAMPRHQDWAMLATSDRVEIIDPDTASVLQESSFPSDRLQSVAVSSHVAVAGFQSGMVRIFSASTPRRHAAGKAVGSAPAGLGGCFAVPHGRWILAWSHRTVVVVDWVTGSVRCILEGNDTGVFLNKVISACCFAPDGSWVATADDNGTIRVWDPDTGRQVAQARGQNGEDFVPGRCAGTRWMATVALDGRVWIRDRLGAKARDLGLVTGLRQACAGGDAWLAIEHDAGISLWDPLNGEHLRELPGERGGFPVRSGPAARFRLAAISTSGVIRITEPLSGQMQSLASRPGGQKAWRAGARVSCADPDGSWLATTDDDGGLDVWYVTSGAREKLSGGYEDPVTGCAVTSDGAMLASARRSGALHVWDTARWRRVAVARVRANLGECCWSPAGTSLCAAGDAGAYRFDLLDMRASDVG